MALLSASGFIGDFSVSGKSEWFAVSGGPLSVASPGSGRGPYSLRVNSLSSGTVKRVGSQFIATVTTGDTYHARFYLYVATLPSAANVILLTNTAATSGTLTNFPNIGLSSTGTLLGKVGNTAFATSSALSLNTWYRVELSWTRNTGAADSVVTLTLDGVTVGSTTTASLVADIDCLILGGNLNSEAQTTGDWYIADLQINDSTTGANNTLPGAGRVTYLHPNASGALADAGATASAGQAYECVDEISPNNTTDYINLSANSADWNTTGSRILLGCTDAAVGGIGSGDTITAISVGMVFSGATATACAAIPGIRSGTAVIEDVGTTRSIASTSDVFLDDTNATAIYSWRLVDGDAAAWTAAKLDSLQIGCRGTDTSPNVQVTTLWAIVLQVPNSSVTGSPYYAYAQQ
jgi:hypothetical protein